MVMRDKYVVNIDEEFTKDCEFYVTYFLYLNNMFEAISAIIFKIKRAYRFLRIINFAMRI